MRPSKISEMIFKAYQENEEVTIRTTDGKIIPKFDVEEKEKIENGTRFIGGNNTSFLYCDILIDDEGGVVTEVLYRGIPPEGNEIGEIQNIKLV